MDTKDTKLKQEVLDKPKRKRIGGRQKGTPNKITATMREMARPYGKKALLVLRRLLTSDNEQIRLAAAKELIDRGHGKAQQVIENTGTQTVEIVTTDTDLARRAAFMLTRAERAERAEKEETRH